MTADFPVTIYHDPACGTSRDVLARIVGVGYAPGVVRTRSIGWTRPLLVALLAAMDARPRDILREGDTPARDLGLLDPATSDAAILDAMVAHPILVAGPIVVTPKGVALCRPAETVLDLLETLPHGIDHPIAA